MVPTHRKAGSQAWIGDCFGSLTTRDDLKAKPGADRGAPGGAIQRPMAFREEYFRERYGEAALRAYASDSRDVGCRIDMTLVAARRSECFIR